MSRELSKRSLPSKSLLNPCHLDLLIRKVSCFQSLIGDAPYLLAHVSIGIIPSNRNFAPLCQIDDDDLVRFLSIAIGQFYEIRKLHRRVRHANADEADFATR